MKKKISDWVTYNVIIVILFIAMLLCVFPLINIIAVSFSARSAAEANLVTFFPVKFTLESYRKIIEDRQFLNSFFVSFKRVILGVTIQFLITSVTAFALSRRPKEFRHRDIYMWFIIFNMMFNGGLVPHFMTVRALGLIDSMWALVLPCAVPIFSLLILMNFFRNLPKEMDEACHIDGAGPWTLLLKIYLPLSLPALATVTLFSIVGHWNSFFDGLIYINRTDRYPLATYIQAMVVQQISANMTMEEMMEISMISTKTLNAAKVAVCIAPVLAIYPFLQRYFIHGIMIGSVKG